jgi:flotillin
MFFYHVPQPDQALLISGKKQRGGTDALPFKIVTGHGAFVMPIVARASTLTLAMQEAEVVEDCYSTQGLTLAVHAVIAFKVGNDAESIAAAARRFLGDQTNDRMKALVGRIFAGHLRSIVGSMTVEDIIRNQQQLGDNILTASKPEMGRIGLVVDSLQISQISDKDSGYIAALSAPHRAAVDQAAQIAKAQAEQAAAKAQQESERNQAQFARDTDVARAEYQAEIEAAQQKASQAGPLASAEATQAVLVEQAKVAQRNAELREQELIAEVVKPAEAEAQRVRVEAEADAAATRLRANAAATAHRIALDQQVIEQLPEIINAAAAGLQGSNLTVFNGGEGVNQMVTTLLSQGLSVLDTVRTGLAGTIEPAAITDGSDGEYVDGDDGSESEPVDEAVVEEEPPAVAKRTTRRRTR